MAAIDSKHTMLYDAFEWEAPEFVHLPLLLNPNRRKLQEGRRCRVRAGVQGGRRVSAGGRVALSLYLDEPRDAAESFSMKGLEEAFSRWSE